MVPSSSKLLTLEVLPIADDAVMRAGLAAMVLQSGRLVTTVPGTSRHGITAALARSHVHALVWDASSDFPSSAELLAANAAHWPPTLMVVSDASNLRDALQAGARGVVGRDAEPEALGIAIEAIVRGLSVFSPQLLASLLPTRADTGPVEPLTSRETEVLSLLAEGMSNKSIAEHLHISEHTSKFHVNAVMTKLGVQTRTEAVTRAIRLGLIIL